MRTLAGGVFGSGSFSAYRDIGKSGHRVIGTRSHTSVPIFVAGAAFFIFRLRIFHPGRDDDFHGQLFVYRRDKVTAAAIVEDAHDGLLLALHHTDDPAFSAAVMPEAAHFDQNLVAMHGVANFRRRDKDVTLELALSARRE